MALAFSDCRLITPARSTFMVAGLCFFLPTDTHPSSYQRPAAGDANTGIQVDDMALLTSKSDADGVFAAVMPPQG